MGALIARRDSQKKRLHVEFDENMNPVGREEDSFISYLRFLARSKVRIVYSAWKFVPDKTKELIWTQILQTFDVPNTKAMKKHWMGEDILSMAIGKPDYPDAVRGETRGVSVAKFFGRRSRLCNVDMKKMEVGMAQFGVKMIKNELQDELPRIPLSMDFNTRLRATYGNSTISPKPEIGLR
ncbi:hypothetical protein K1719_032858 [Acacia pycnantha]|nr:hypothetical protein K1719_032858 [Acacia pycnantha]